MQSLIVFILYTRKDTSHFFKMFWQFIFSSFSLWLCYLKFLQEVLQRCSDNFCYIKIMKFSERFNFSICSIIDCYSIHTLFL